MNEGNNYQRRVSNGARAAQAAAEEFERLESERDDLRRQVAELEGRLAEKDEQLYRITANRDLWFQKAMRLANSVVSTSAVLLDSAAVAREVLKENEGQ